MKSKRRALADNLLTPRAGVELKGRSCARFGPEPRKPPRVHVRRDPRGLAGLKALIGIFGSITDDLVLPLHDIALVHELSERGEVIGNIVLGIG